MSKEGSISRYLPKRGARPTPDELLSAFLSHTSERGLALYPAQEEAILALYEGKHVVLSTPTGSGKSLVAEALHFKTLAEGGRSFYTCPIKALVNEKFFAFCELFGPEAVGMMTGDASVNRDAPIICCTAEVLANLALGEEGAEIDAVVMDEFHYYADKERGVAWQVPLLAMPKTQFLLLSATLGETAQLEERLKAVSRREVAAVGGLARPVPLTFEYRETPLHETIAKLIEESWAPIYLVNFTQRAAAENAQALTSVQLLSKEEREAIRKELVEARFDSPYGKDVERYLRAGVGLHHAGLLPKYRRLTERLAQRGLLKVVSGTDTLGMGINIPLRTVLFTQLCKFDGEKTAIMKVRDFHQIAGRAGRKGFDDEGKVVAQAPEYVIENLRLAAKAAGGKKVTKKQPPTKNYVHWDRATFERLQTKQPEPLESRFHVTFPMLVALLQTGDLWPMGGYGRLIELIGRSHESERAKQRHKLRAAQMVRALRRAGIVELIPCDDRAACYLRVSSDLQEDFSLFQALSLYLVSAVGVLDPESESYALDLLSFVEATLEDPMAVLFRQTDLAKERKLFELKANGVPYEDRIAELEKVEYPKPCSELIHGTFAAFAETHPWVRSEDIRPKSVARDLFERLSSFNDYIVEYGLQRSEGVLLRYLSEVWRALTQTIPESARDDILEEIIAHLRAVIRGVDSSLIDEWERLMGYEPSVEDAQRAAPGAPRRELAPDDPRRLAANPKAFAARVRSEAHRLLKALAERRYADALAALRPLEGEPEWSAQLLEEAMAPYFEEHASVDLKPAARLPHNTLIKQEREGRWEVLQKLVDPEGEADWVLHLIVELGGDVAEALAPDAPLIALRRIGT